MKAKLALLFYTVTVLLLVFATSCDNDNTGAGNEDPQQQLPDFSNLPEIPGSNETIELELDQPMPTGNVHDYEEVFTKQEELKMDSMLQVLEKTTGVEMVILTIEDSYTTETDFDNYTQQTMSIMMPDPMGQGNSIMLAFSTGLRKVRINKGDGVSNFWPDPETETFINSYLLPKYITGDYYKGTMDGLEEIIVIAQHRAPKAWMKK